MDDTSQSLAWEELERKSRILTQLCRDMPAARQSLEHCSRQEDAEREYQLLCAQKERLREALCDISQSLRELGEDSLAEDGWKLREALEDFNPMIPDYGPLTDTVRFFQEHLPRQENQLTNTGVIGRLMNQVRMGYYPTEPAHVDRIARGIAFPGTIRPNLLDPCCGCGLALERLAAGQNCETFGVELDEGRLREAEARLDHIAGGSFFQSRISLNAFHLLFLNPPYLAVRNESGRTARHEKRFLVNGLGRLMKGGLLVYIIPYYRLTWDIARILSDNFADLSAYRFMEAEFNRFHQIAVFGVRKEYAASVRDAEALMAVAASPENLPELSDLPSGRYALPDTAKEVRMFRGAIFNEAELARQFAASRSLSRLLEKSNLDGKIRHPLLPLGAGQIAMLGCSGRINGLIEGHIIKGTVTRTNQIKQSVSKQDEQGRPTEIQCEETRRNVLSFGILTPEGYKSLLV